MDDITFLRGDKYTPGGDACKCSVRIFDDSITHGFSKRGIPAEVEPLEHILDHELGHIFSDSFLQKNEYNVMDDVALSIRKDFKNAGVEDALHHEKKGLTPQKVSYYAEKNQSENFAEVTAGVSNLKRGNNYKVYAEKVKRPDESRISGFVRDKPTLQEVKSRNPNQYKYVDNLIDHPETVMKNWKSINQQRVKESRAHFNEFLKQEQKVVRAKQNMKEYNKFAFSQEDKLKYDELYKIKQGNKLKGSRNRHALELLENQKELDSLHKKFIKNGKLSSKDAKRYKELHNNPRIKRKFKLELLDDAKLEGKHVSPVIKDEPYTGDINDPKNIKQFKGTTKDGMLPGNENIDNYFTKNVSTTGKHDEIIKKWVYEAWYNDAQFYHNKLQWDEKKLRKWVKKEFKELSVAEQEAEIQNILYEWKQFKELMKDSELKKNMLLHRAQPKLHGWPNARVGQRVTINANRSFSISKEGVEEYRKGGKKGWWNIELEAPVKTKGVYISPKAISNEHNNKYIHQMEVIVGPDTPAEIIYIDPDPDKKLIRLRAIV